MACGSALVEQHRADGMYRHVPRRSEQELLSKLTNVNLLAGGQLSQLDQHKKRKKNAKKNKTDPKLNLEFYT